MKDSAMFSMDEIARIAGLAALELTEEEKELLAHQFEEILAYFKIIDSAPLSGGGGEEPAEGLDHFREDRAIPSGISPEDYSPYLENGHFKVPKIIE